MIMTLRRQPQALGYLMESGEFADDAASRRSIALERVHRAVSRPRGKRLMRSFFPHANGSQSAALQGRGISLR
jgi:hypothetical protein